MRERERNTAETGSISETPGDVEALCFVGALLTVCVHVGSEGWLQPFLTLQPLPWGSRAVLPPSRRTSAPASPGCDLAASTASCWRGLPAEARGTAAESSAGGEMGWDSNYFSLQICKRSIPLHTRWMSRVVREVCPLIKWGFLDIFGMPRNLLLGNAFISRIRTADFKEKC